MKSIKRVYYILIFLFILSLSACSCGNAKENGKNTETKTGVDTEIPNNNTDDNLPPNTSSKDDNYIVYLDCSIILKIKIFNYDFKNFDDNLNYYSKDYKIGDDGSIEYTLMSDLEIYEEDIDSELDYYFDMYYENIFFLGLDNKSYSASIIIKNDKDGEIDSLSFEGRILNNSTYYTVNFYNDDETLLETIIVLEGKAAVYPNSDPVSTKLNEYTNYEFVGWDSYLSQVNSDMDVYPIYSKIIIPHTVNYYDIDGTTLLYHKDATSEDEMKFVGNYPTKDTDLENDISYSFSEWEVKYADDTRIDYIPVFESYTRGLVFDGNILKAYVGTKKEVHLPTRVNGTVITIIGPQCFETRSIEKVYLSDSITTICEKAFFNVTTLTDIVFSNNLKYIETQAFNGCEGLTLITLPSSLETIGLKAFNGCSSIKTLTIPVGVTYKEYGGMPIEFNDIFNNTILDKLYLIEGSSSSLDSYLLRGTTIKEIYIMDGVTEIDSQAFIESYGLEYVYFGKDIKLIGSEAARSLSTLKEIQIVGTNTVIKEGAFLGCTNLKTANLGNTIKLENNVFNNCGKLETFKADKLTVIGNSVFNNCISLSSFKVSDSVESIGTSAFESCFRLTEVTLGNKLESIGNSAFKNCSSLSIIYIYSNLKTIGSDCFTGCTSLSYIFSVNELKPINYTAGWYGKAQPIFGYLRTEIDNNYTYYYAIEYDYKKVYMLNKDLSPISTENDLPRFINEYEVILLSNPTVTHISSIIRDTSTLEELTASGTKRYMYDINYSDLFKDLSPSIIPIYRLYTASSWSYQYKRCTINGIGSYNKLILRISNTSYSSDKYATLINNNNNNDTSPTWNLVWNNDCYLAYYGNTDFYMTFKDTTDDYLEIEIYGEFIETYDDPGDIDNPGSTDEPGNTDNPGSGGTPETPETPEVEEELIVFELSSDGTYYIAKSLTSHTFTELIIPSEYNNKPVKEIANSFDQGSMYTNRFTLTIPSSVVSIGNNAFYGSSITSLTLNEGLEHIGEYAFANMLGSLSTVNIPSTVTSMGSNPFAFSDSLNNITFNNGSNYFTFSDKALYTKDMKKLIGVLRTRAGSFTIPSTVEVIGKSAISSLKYNHSVTIPKSVTKIETLAFASDVMLESITYLGTKSEFSKITKEENWEPYLQYITCSDGEYRIN